MTTDERPFLEAILCNPDSDVERLVYADWLEEHGQGKRAEFIRVQVELAKIDDHCANSWVLTERTEEGYCFGRPIPCRRCELRRRERELLLAGYHDWIPFRGEENQAWCINLTGSNETHGVPAFGFHRGFIECVSCTAADWLKHGRQIVRCQPIRDGGLTLTGAARLWPQESVNAWHGIRGTIPPGQTDLGTERKYWEQASLVWARMEPCPRCQGLQHKLLGVCHVCQGQGAVDFRTLLVRAGGKDSGSRPTLASPELPSSE